MLEAYIKKIIQSVSCVTGVYSREIINMIFISQESGLIKNFNIGKYSDTINMIMPNFAWWYYPLSFTCS